MILLITSNLFSQLPFARETVQEESATKDVHLIPDDAMTCNAGKKSDEKQCNTIQKCANPCNLDDVANMQILSSNFECYSARDNARQICCECSNTKLEQWEQLCQSSKDIDYDLTRNAPLQNEERRVQRRPPS